MKGFLLLLSMGCLWQTVAAQTSLSSEVNLDRYNKMRKQMQLAPLMEKRQQSQLPQGFPVNIKQPNTVQLPLAHANALGEVYVMPQDNMLMLKPYVGGANPMPGTNAPLVQNNELKAGRIPNAVPVQPYAFQSGNQPLQ